MTQRSIYIYRLNHWNCDLSRYSFKFHWSLEEHRRVFRTKRELEVLGEQWTSLNMTSVIFELEDENGYTDMNGVGVNGENVVGVNGINDVSVRNGIVVNGINGVGINGNNDIDDDDDTVQIIRLDQSYNAKQGNIFFTFFCISNPSQSPPPTKLFLVHVLLLLFNLWFCLMIYYTSS